LVERQGFGHALEVDRPTGREVQVMVVGPPGSLLAHHDLSGPCPGGDPGGQVHGPSVPFDRFWRSPASERRDGTGLGLAIVRQLLEASGGTAELRPSPDGGLEAVAHLRPADHGIPIPSHQPTCAATSSHVDH
jgi:hypothetical protein